MNNKLNLAIVGSRNFFNYDFLEFVVLNNYNINNIVKIISGGATGTDNLAEQFAKKYKIQLKVFYPDWKLHGKKAGFIRNKEIIENCNSVLSFWDYKSKGTKLTIDLAEKNNKQLKIINISKLIT